MTPGPKTIAEGELAVKAVAVLQAHSISQLIVTDEAGSYLGFVHLHDFIREGLV